MTFRRRQIATATLHPEQKNVVIILGKKHFYISFSLLRLHKFARRFLLAKNLQLSG